MFFWETVIFLQFTRHFAIFRYIVINNMKKFAFAWLLAFLFAGCHFLGDLDDSDESFALTEQSQIVKDVASKDEVATENLEAPLVAEDAAEEAVDDHTPVLVTVKYKAEPVDIALFETTDTSKSSFIRGAWYDPESQYLILKMSGVHYQYCGVPPAVWTDFKAAKSLGTYFNTKIKGKWGCK